MLLWQSNFARRLRQSDKILGCGRGELQLNLNGIERIVIGSHYFKLPFLGGADGHGYRRAAAA
jgi:hypothetical protein